jgi:hypothetical protein
MSSTSKRVICLLINGGSFLLISIRVDLVVYVDLATTVE